MKDLLRIERFFNHAGNCRVLLEDVPRRRSLVLDELVVALATEHVLAGIELRIEVNDENVFAKLVELPSQVDGQSRFTDSAFHVEKRDRCGHKRE